MARFLILVASLLAIQLTVSLGDSGRTRRNLNIIDAQSKETCKFSVEIAHMQDVTNSYYIKIANLAQFLPSFFNGLVAKHPHSKFSYGTFRDKPVEPRGYSDEDDHCYYQKTSFADVLDKSVSEIKASRTHGGMDWPEAQLEGLYRSILNPGVGWSTGRKADDGLPVVRIVVIATESLFHRPGKLLEAWKQLKAEGRAPYPNPPHAHNITMENADVLKANNNVGCATMDYPEPAQIAKVLKAKKILPIFLLSPTETIDCRKDQSPWNTTLCPPAPMHKRGRVEGNPDWFDTKKGLAMFYQELMKEMDIDGVISFTDGSMGNYVEAMDQAINKVKDLVCEPIEEDECEDCPECEEGEECVECEDCEDCEDCDNESTTSPA